MTTEEERNENTWNSYQEVTQKKSPTVKTILSPYI